VRRVGCGPPRHLARSRTGDPRRPNRATPERHAVASPASSAGRVPATRARTRRRR
jgi:hypothetical protein